MMNAVWWIFNETGFSSAAKFFNKIFITIFFISEDEQNTRVVDGVAINKHASPGNDAISFFSEDELCFDFLTSFFQCKQKKHKQTTTTCLITFLFFFIIVAGFLRTSFISGSAFNVTWHLAYPHRVSIKEEKKKSRCFRWQSNYETLMVNHSFQSQEEVFSSLGTFEIEQIKTTFGRTWNILKKIVDETFYWFRKTIDVFKIFPGFDGLEKFEVWKSFDTWKNFSKLAQLL